MEYIERDHSRFTVNFHHAAADFSGNDVPLHISVRFDEGKVRDSEEERLRERVTLQIVLNSFSKGEWGKEERKSNPYKKVCTR